MNEIVIIGYSGHSYVAIDVLSSQDRKVVAYVEVEEKVDNPYQIHYLGTDQSVQSFDNKAYFVGIGDHRIREKVTIQLEEKTGQKPTIAIDKSAQVSSSVEIGSGSLFSPGCIVNAQVKIGEGCIINTGAIVEHECRIGNYSHVAPGAILCGNVTVGKNSFIGAGSVVKEGIIIGDHVIIGAGTVVIKNIENNHKVVGNPQREL